MDEYNHKEIETKWQEKWEEQGIYKTPDTTDGKENFYTLVEFAYPSGNLHVGHWYAFAVTDIFARFKRMQGHNVLFPFGFDAFGLPAENAAIKHGVNPHEWTRKNISYMREQVKSMGAMFDWSREITTSDPEYYTWTQWLFLQFFKNGLAYQEESEEPWCPSCKTVLAREQVLAGECERCGATVERRLMNQWHLKITDYAERLLDGLEELEWPEEIKTAQRNWIGKSEGAVIPFELRGSRMNADDTRMNTDVEVFTTRPDTLFGATYLVLAPEHKLVEKVKDSIQNRDEVVRYIVQSKKKTEIERTAEGKEKTGVELKGIKAVNPATKEEIPVFIADYVLAHYGTGAIMAVPAHDERDREFADDAATVELRRHPGLKYVIKPNSYGDFKKSFFPDQFHLTHPGQSIQDAQERDHRQWYEEYLEYSTNNDWRGKRRGYYGEGTLINSGEFDGMTSDEAREKITQRFGRKETTYKLHDWTVSRQRYWGCPIPVIHCEKCGAVPVSEKDLPVELPELDDFLPSGDGRSPLAKAESWVKTACPECKGEAKRETDTLDTFVDSSWYFLRYTDPYNSEAFASKEKQKHWMPVDFYSGGAEHTTMHLLYSRFFHKALHDFGLVADSEPYMRRMNRGIILGPDGNKMSKSKGNVIDPDEWVERLGADTVRMYLGFIGPYNEVGAYPWSPDSIIGVRKFLERVWRYAHTNMSKEDDKDIEPLLHQLIKEAEDDASKLKFNTAIARCMSFLNDIKDSVIGEKQFKMFVLVLAPFAPHIAEELWEKVDGGGSIHEQAWPEYNEKLLQKEEITIVAQVDGKNRGEFTASPGLSEADAESKARELGGVGRHLEGKEVVRVVYVPDRLVNIVTK